MLPRNLKRLLLIGIDIISLWFALWLALVLRADEFFLPTNGYELTQAQPSQLYDVFFLTAAITLPILIFSRLYRSITRYMTLETYIKVAKACIVSGVIWALTVYFLNYPIPRTASIIYVILSTIFGFFLLYVSPKK